MAREPVRAEYRYAKALLVVPALLLGTFVLPIVMLFVDVAPWWQEALFLLIAIGLGWSWVLFRMVYRMQLTDSALVLRVPLGRTRIPLDELERIGSPARGSGFELTRRDGRTWHYRADDGIVAFLEEVARLAPDADVEIGRTARLSDRHSG